MTSDIVSPAPSKLGTKSHWDSVYDTEISNLNDFGDEGEVWFGEDVADEMVEWVTDNFPDDKEIKIMDVGCGNGDLVFRLDDAGYKNAVGVDYSEPGVLLARSIAVRRGMKADPVKTFQVRDMLKESSDNESWDLVCDKGTYDAISLSKPDNETDSETPTSPIQLYVQQVPKLLKRPGGILLITSCNWTKEELQAAFVTPSSELAYHSHIPRPSFTFGGSTGQTITTVAFMRR